MPTTLIDPLPLDGRSVGALRGGSGGRHRSSSFVTNSNRAVEEWLGLFDHRGDGWQQHWRSPLPQQA